MWRIFFSYFRFTDYGRSITLTLMTRYRVSYAGNFLDCLVQIMKIMKYSQFLSCLLLELTSHELNPNWTNGGLHILILQKPTALSHVMRPPTVRCELVISPEIPPISEYTHCMLVSEFYIMTNAPACKMHSEHCNFECQPEHDHWTWTLCLGQTTSAARDTRIHEYLRSQVFTSVTKKITVFFDVTSYSLVHIYRRFGGKYCSMFRTETKRIGVMVNVLTLNRETPDSILAIMTEVSRGVSQSLHVTPGIVSRLGHKGLLPNPFQHIIHPLSHRSTHTSEGDDSWVTIVEWSLAGQNQ
jgi:hypothetical protein